MSNQNTDENPYAPPKTALDFGQPEKISKKQRQARIRLGGYSLCFLSGITIWVMGLDTAEAVLPALFWLPIFLFSWLLIAIVPCAIFAYSVEYLGTSLISKMLIGLMVCLVLMYAVQWLLQKYQIAYFEIAHYIFAAIFAVITVLIMNAHKKRCAIQSLQSQPI